MVGSIITFIIPTILQFYVQLRNKNVDEALETLPQFVTCAACIIKLLSLHFNRENFRKVFLTVESDWQNQLASKELDILEEITGKGSTIAYRYRGILLTFFVSFVAIPLVNPMLDIVLPLNKTRSREEIFSLYYYVNNDEYFYAIYLHSAWCAIIAILSIVAVDSLNMIITHHASAMFAICGSMIDKATECNDVATVGRGPMDDGLEKIRECVAAHNKAIQFFDFLDATNRMNFLLQVGFNMIGISVSAFQAVRHLDDMKRAVRYALFFGGQKFHLYFLSLPGQILSDYSAEVLDHIYNSKWYQTSAKMQRMMNIMQLRASKPCQLTAGGLYEMNIENFGAAFKTCMSYFTMLLSMKD
ncbi:odorant receptor 9a-like [Andrena cerasifolii]|uniref:odorant receptor 9a-like n=1 Tax=Andrena cerasifolii TaxID=2819439 RepID=UPI004037F1FD